MPGPIINKLKKDIFKFFKDQNINITLDINLIQVDFLDVSLNIQTDKFWPLRKQNSETIYKQALKPPKLYKISDP